MKKLFLSIACLTALAAVNADARFFGGGCNKGGCAVAPTCAAPKCEPRVCFMEKCVPCVHPKECWEERRVEDRKCIVMEPVEKTYQVEIICRHTKVCEESAQPLSACGEQATHFSNGQPIDGSGTSFTQGEVASSKRIRKGF